MVRFQMTDDLEPPTGDGRIGLVATGTGLIRWLVIVVVVLLVGEATARGVVGRTADEIRWYDAAAQQRIELLDRRGDSVHVAFAGTSAAWQAFVPAEFTRESGRTSINVGLAGAVPTVTGPWLTNEVVPRSSPDLVVWGLTPLDFAPAYGELQEAAYDTAVETADGWLADIDRSVSSVSTLVASRRLLRSPSELFGSGETRRRHDLADAAATTGPDGERIDFVVDQSAQRRAIQRSRLAGYEVDRGDVDAVVDAIESMRTVGITVVLVEVPVPDRFLDQLPQRDRDVAASRAAMREIGQTTGSDVIFMGDALGDTNFVDDIHVDADAAALTTQWVAQVISVLDDVTPANSDGDCPTVDVVDEIGFVVPIDVCRNAATR